MTKHEILVFILISIAFIIVLFKIKSYLEFWFSSKYKKAKSLVGEPLIVNEDNFYYVKSAIRGNPGLVNVCRLTKEGECIYYVTTVAMVERIIKKNA